MKLRKLDVKDAPFMLEWMHSADVVKIYKLTLHQKLLQIVKIL